MADRDRRKRTAASEQRTDPTSQHSAPKIPKAFLQAFTALIVLGSAGWLVYGRALRYPFIFDDYVSVLQNPSITTLWPLVGESSPLFAPFDSPTAGRPLVNLSLAINYHFSQYDTFGYHVVNLSLHVLSALLLWSIVQRTLRLPCFGDRFTPGAFSIALLVALAWLVHPLQTEAVEYVTQRTELMMGFFYLGTLYGSLRYFCAITKSHRAIWLAVAAGACLLGMSCKEVMVTAPLVVLLFERTFIAGSFLQALRRSWPLYLLLTLTWAVLILCNYGGPRSVSAGFGLRIPAHVWWFTQAKVLFLYLKLVFWPWPLSIHYRVPLLQTFGDAWPWLGLAALLAIGTIMLLWRGVAAGFLAAFAFLILSPTLVIPIIKEVAVERRMYLPLAAILTLVIAGGYWVLQFALGDRPSGSDKSKYDRRPLSITITCIVALVVAMCLVSSLRLTAYQDSVTLWKDAVLRDPDDVIAIHGVGVALNDAQRGEEAVEFMQKVLERDPESTEANHILGTALLNLNRSAEAIPHLRKAIHGEDAALAHYYLGIALMNVGQPDEAVEHLKAIVEQRPNDAEFQNRLGMAMTLAGRPHSAVECFNKAVSLAPDSPVIRTNLGCALRDAGRAAEASKELEEAVRMAPDYADAHTQLAIVYADLGRSADAVAMAEKALQLAKAAGNAPQVQFLQNWLNEHRRAN